MDKQIVCNTFTAVCPQPKLVIYEISSKNIVSGSLIVYPGDVVLPKIGEQSDFDLVPSGPVSVHLGESASVSAAWSMDVGCLEVSAAIPVPITGTTEYRYEVFQLCNLVPYVIDFTPQNRDGGGTVIFTGAGMVREWTVDLIIDAVPILTGPSAVLYGNSVDILLTLDRDPQGDIEVMVAMSPEVGYTMNSSNWSTGITLPFTPTVGNNVVTARYGSEIATWTVDIEYISLVLFGDTTVVNGQSASVLVKLSEDPLRTMTIVAHFPDGTTETFTLGTSDWNSGHTVTYTPTEESGGTVTFNPAGYPEGQWDVAILPPTYAVTPNTVSVMETQSVIFTVNTTGVLNGTTLYWTATGTTSAADFVDNMLSGSFTVNSNTAQIVRAIVDDLTIEDDESFVLQIRTGSTSGTVVATSTSVLVTDKVTIRTYGLDVAITPTEIITADSTFVTQSDNEQDGGYVGFLWKRSYKYGVDENLDWTPLSIVDDISAETLYNNIIIPSPAFIADTWDGHITSGGADIQVAYDGQPTYNKIDILFRLNGFPKESTAYYQSTGGSQDIYSEVAFSTLNQHRFQSHTLEFAESRGNGAIYAGGTGGQFVGSIGGNASGVALISGQKVNPYPLDKLISGGKESFTLQPYLTTVGDSNSSTSISYQNENFWKFEPYFEYDSKLDPYLILRELINIHRYIMDYRTYLTGIGQNAYQQFVSISSASYPIMIDPNITRTQFEALPTSSQLRLEISALDPNNVGNDMGIQFRDIHQRVVDIFKTRVTAPRAMDNTYVANQNMTMYGAVSLYGGLATASGSVYSKFQWVDYHNDVYTYGEEKREGVLPTIPSVDARRYTSPLGDISSLQSWIVQPIYYLEEDVDPVTEGSVITYTVRTYEVPDGTTLYWTTSGNTVAADYFGNIMSGTVVISGGTAQFTRVVIADHLTDPGEHVITELRTTSFLGTIKATSTVSITDTSLNPTYEVLGPTPINEGTTATFVVNTTDVPDGTTLYWTSTGTTNAADFVGSIVSGTISISGNTGSFTRTLVNDVTVEGSENFTIQIRTGSIVGTVAATSSATVVNDTSQSLSYNMIPDVSEVDEGGTVTYSITTTALPDGTTLYWTTTGTANAADFTDGQLTGSVVINSNAGTITRTLVADVTAEGSENFALQLRTGSIAGTIVVNGSSITINDTSIGPTYAITPLNMWNQPTTSFNEGDQIVVQVDTTLVDDGTTLYWTLNGTTDSADFASGITGGPIDIYYGFNMFAIQTVLDSDVEGTETFAIQLRTGSIAGPVVATSSTISLSEVPVEFHLDMLWPGYSISEGDMLAINLIATGLAEGTTVYYTIESPTMTAVDFTGGMSGSFTMSAYWMGPGVTAGGIQIYTNVDSDTAADEQFTVKVRTGSISGPVAMTLGPFVVLNVSP
jgi:hypothetical protein